MGVITIKEVYNKLIHIEEHMATKEDIEPLIDTIGILSNHDTIEALNRSDADIRQGRVKQINGVADLLDELDNS